MTPSEASLKKNEATVYRNLYPDYDRQSSKPKFKIGDRVRITKKKTMFEKSCTPRWTEEVFTVSEIQYTDPPCLLYTSPSPRDRQKSRMPSSA